MADMPSHDQRECADLCRPEDIGVRGCLRSPLQQSMMDRAQFIHMVALIGAGSGIHEREHSGYKQGGFMMGDGKRACEYGACLTVLALAVAEEQRVCC